MATEAYFLVKWDNTDSEIDKFKVAKLDYEFTLSKRDGTFDAIRKNIIDHLRSKCVDINYISQFNDIRSKDPDFASALIIPINILDVLDKVEKYTITLPSSLVKEIDQWVSRNRVAGGDIKTRSGFLAEGAIGLLKEVSK